MSKTAKAEKQIARLQKRWGKQWNYRTKVARHRMDRAMNGELVGPGRLTPRRIDWLGDKFGHDVVVEAFATSDQMVLDLLGRVRVVERWSVIKKKAVG